MTVYTEKFLLQPAGLNLHAKSWLVYKTDQFVASCFGDYLNVWMGVECLPLLYHYHMCKEFTTFDPFDLEELLFPIGDNQVCFDIKIFSLSPACGPGSISPIVGFVEFRWCVFAFVSLLRLVRVANLMHMLNNLLHLLSNADTVRVYLMYMLV